MKNNNKITLVVPIRNCVNVLDAFFACLKKQTFSDFSVCFSLGTSIDGTKEKLDAIKLFESSIDFVVQDVGLLSVGESKNYWLSSNRVSSKYIVFVDADDYLYPTYLQELIDNAEKTNADLVQCGFERVESESGKRISTDQVSNPKMITDVFRYPGIVYIHTATWNKLFRMSLIDENVRFHDGKKFEDLHFVISYLAKCHTISSINKPLYRYYVSKNSLSSIKSKEVLLANNEEVKQTCLSLKRTFSTLNPKAFETGFLDALIFLRYGIGFTTRMCLSGHGNRKLILRESKSFLDKEFPLWRNNWFFQRKNAKQIGKKSLFVLWCVGLYKRNNFGLFVSAYKIYTTTFHKDIKP